VSDSRRGAAVAQVAFVLHSHDWSESSLILELFTRDAGRVVAAAKGAKRPTSQLRAVLMPFQRISVQFARSRGDEGSEVRTLRSAEWGGAAVPMHGAAWFAGFYLNELLLRLLARDDAHPRLFDAYAAALACVSDSEFRSESALRAFELLLLQETGVLPELHRTTLTQATVLADRRYVLRPDQGLAEAAPHDTALSGACCLALAGALGGWPMADDDGVAFAKLQQACAADLSPLKAQLRAQLHYHLGGAGLRTRQVMIDSQRLFEADPTRR
jgi:DNA repair protein RecO (recombination protein O)